MIIGYLYECDNGNCKKEFIVRNIKNKNIAMDEMHCPKCIKEEKNMEEKNANS